MRPDRFVTAALLLTAAALGTSMRAQGPEVLLRYHPRVGSQIIMLGNMKLTQVVSLAGEADTQRTITTISAATSRQVVRQESGRLRVRVTVDSVSGAMELGGVRRDVPTQTVREWVEMLVDSLGRPSHPPTGPAGTSPDSAKRFQTWQTQMYDELAFPIEPVHKGYRWTSNITRSMGELGVSQLPVPGAEVPPLHAHLDAIVDSIIPRGTDTLVYVSMNSRVDPFSISFTESGARITMTVAGGKSTAQIWSTGWQGWVGTGSHAHWDLTMTGTENGKPQKGLAVFDVVQSGRLRY